MKKLLIAFVVVIAGMFIASQARADIGIDASSSVKQSNTALTNVAVPAFTTANANDLILVIFSVGDNGTNGGTLAATSSNPSLTFTSVIKKSVQGGAVEIFRAYATSTVTNMVVRGKCTANCGSANAGDNLTVYALSGVDTTSGDGSSAIGAAVSSSNPSATVKAPSSTIVTTRNGSWIFSGLDDFDTSRAFTAGSGQSINSQENSTSNDTELDLRQNATTTTSGTSVVMNLTPSSGDAWNMADVEVLAPAAASGATNANQNSMGSGIFNVSATLNVKAGLLVQ